MGWGGLGKLPKWVGKAFQQQTHPYVMNIPTPLFPQLLRTIIDQLNLFTPFHTPFISHAARAPSSRLVITLTQASQLPLPLLQPVLNTPRPKTSCPRKLLRPRVATTSFNRFTRLGSTCDCKLLTAAASNLPIENALLTAVAFDQSLERSTCLYFSSAWHLMSPGL